MGHDGGGPHQGIATVMNGCHTGESNGQQTAKFVARKTQMITRTKGHFLSIPMHDAFQKTIAQSKEKEEGQHQGCAYKEDYFVS